MGLEGDVTPTFNIETSSFKIYIEFPLHLELFQIHVKPASSVCT